jgi:hypothetical protein
MSRIARVVILVLLMIGCALPQAAQPAQRQLVLSKINLRGLYEKQKNKEVGQCVRDGFHGLYERVLHSAKRGNNQLHFTIMCVQVTMKYPSDRDKWNCTTYDGTKEWLRQANPSHPVIKYGVSTQSYTENILSRLNATFPDSKLTTLRNNCCDYYMLKW